MGPCGTPPGSGIFSFVVFDSSDLSIGDGNGPGGGGGASING